MEINNNNELHLIALKIDNYVGSILLLAHSKSLVTANRYYEIPNRNIRREHKMKRTQINITNQNNQIHWPHKYIRIIFGSVKIKMQKLNRKPRK